MIITALSSLFLQAYAETKANTINPVSDIPTGAIANVRDTLNSNWKKSINDSFVTINEFDSRIINAQNTANKAASDVGSFDQRITVTETKVKNAEAESSNAIKSANNAKQSADSAKSIAEGLDKKITQANTTANLANANALDAKNNANQAKNDAKNAADNSKQATNESKEAKETAISAKDIANGLNDKITTANDTANQAKNDAKKAADNSEQAINESKEAKETASETSLSVKTLEEKIGDNDKGLIKDVTEATKKADTATNFTTELDEKYERKTNDISKRIDDMKPTGFTLEDHVIYAHKGDTLETLLKKAEELRKYFGDPVIIELLASEKYSYPTTNEKCEFPGGLIIKGNYAKIVLNNNLCKNKSINLWDKLSLQDLDISIKTEKTDEQVFIFSNDKYFYINLKLLNINLVYDDDNGNDAGFLKVNGGMSRVLFNNVNVTHDYKHFKHISLYVNDYHSDCVFNIINSNIEKISTPQYNTHLHVSNSIFDLEVDNHSPTEEELDNYKDLTILNSVSLETLKPYKNRIQ